MAKDPGAGLVTDDWRPGLRHSCQAGARDLGSQACSLSRLPTEPDVSVVLIFFLNSVGEYEAIEEFSSSEVPKALALPCDMRESSGFGEHLHHTSHHLGVLGILLFPLLEGPGAWSWWSL